MPFRSNRLRSIAVVAALVPLVLGLVRTANSIIVPAGDVITEDLYAFGGRVLVEGTVEGDVFALTGDLTVTGTVTGDVIGFAGSRVTVTGTVGGSLRVVSPTVDVRGAVGDDVAALAAGLSVDAVVGRDVLAVAGDAEVGGTVLRDVRTQAWDLDVRGQVDGDVRAKADRITLADGARVGGDVVYRASADARLAATAVVDGDLVRGRVFSPVWARATERVIAALGLLGLILAGLALGWLFRGTARRAVEAAGTRPGLTAGVGVLLLVLPPLLVIPLSLTLVGLPLALLLAVLWLLAVFLGALPAIAWAGTRLLGGRGGIAAGLVAGAVLWRGAAWLLPLAAVLLYVAGTVWGLGALGRAAWASRSAATRA
ncbi:MAG: hypothetical protein KQH83_09175 [Actinobacteria bacterium]|nr:hypothetical protein [Actinomycetota bacterium]